MNLDILLWVSAIGIERNEVYALLLLQSFDDTLGETSTWVGFGNAARFDERLGAIPNPLAFDAQGSVPLSKALLLHKLFRRLADPLRKEELQREVVLICERIPSWNLDALRQAQSMRTSRNQL